MKLEITKEDYESPEVSVDRDGVRNDFGSQGFYVYFGGLLIHFEDENDAASLAKKILWRLGEEGKP